MILRAIRYYLQKKNANEKNSTYDTSPFGVMSWEPYLGRWFEWARYENPFEFGLQHVYTDYEKSSDGTIKVTNSGYDALGERHTAHGVATIAGTGKLSVSFVPILRFIRGFYHVLFIDSAYRCALVSNDSGSCLWLLGRTPHCEDEQLCQLLSEAQNRGFETQRLLFTAQDTQPR